ncbi:MAG TPA: 3-dehydroquinate synthase family protein [Solirubrobacteraceae bacterium]|jgi:3-dehydroquinate synthase|nr:3-dehydroquinate synthase family protein [Solirubrobacteraceae bacterium]
MLEWLEQDSSFAVQTTNRGSYDIVVQTGARASLAARVRQLADEIGSREAVVVTDELVARHWLDEAVVSLETTGLRVHALTVACGETAKSVDTLAHIWDQLFELGVSRRSLIVAYGGGIICDLAGFVAATYMRGVPYVNVPSSLLAQIDGAIGGKVAVDHPHGKNLLGTFYHPRLVLVDPYLLTTLDRRPLVAGLAEAIKVSVIASRPLFHRIGEWLDAGLDVLDAGLAEPIISECVAIKLNLLRDDPFEVGDLDRLLNLGHEIAHSLEAVTGYKRYLHGEAVAVGVAVAARLAERRGLCESSTAGKILDLLAAAGLPDAIPRELGAAVWDHLDVIRGVRNGVLRIIVPIDIGHCTILPDISLAEYLHCAR